MVASQDKVLVTGAGGFIGSHLVEYLVRQEHNVRCFVRYNSRGDYGHLDQLSKQILDHIEIIQGDLRDPDAVAKATIGVSHVYHLGAIIPIPYSYIHPREVIETNVMGTLNVLTAARDHENIRVVHTSTSEVYGTAQYTPIDEGHPLQGQSPYAASKIAADKIAESFYLSYELPITTVRPFNTFGPRQSTRAILPTLITQVLTQERVLVGDLTTTRDFNFIENLAEAFVLAGNCDEAIGQVINIGTGHEISINDILQRIVQLIGRDISIEQDPQRFRPPKSEVRQLISDARKAERILAWKPRILLEEGLQRTIEWMTEHIHEYTPDRYQV